MADPISYKNSDSRLKIMIRLISVDHCHVKGCANGATCTNILGGSKCTCPPGYYGDSCEDGKLKTFKLIATPN